MHFKFTLTLFFLVLLLAGNPSFAAKDCQLSDALQDPALANNGAFWGEYAQLTARGEISNADFEALVAKHKGNSSSSQAKNKTESGESSDKAEVSGRVTIDDRGFSKVYKKLQPQQREKIDEFLEIIQQPDWLQSLRKAGWNYEPNIQTAKDAHTVRLNNGYRLLFKRIEDNKTGNVTIRLLEANKGSIHGN